MSILHNNKRCRIAPNVQEFMILNSDVARIAESHVGNGSATMLIRTESRVEIGRLSSGPDESFRILMTVIDLQCGYLMIWMILSMKHILNYHEVIRRIVAIIALLICKPIIVGSQMD